MSTPAKLQPITPSAPSAPGKAADVAPVPVTELEFSKLVAAAQAEYYALPEAIRGKVHHALNDAEQQANVALAAIHTLFRAKV
jgi:hypothetical protein